MSLATDAHEDLLTQVIEHLDFEVVCRAVLLPYMELFGVRITLGRPTVCGQPAVALAACRFCNAASPICQAHEAEMLQAPAVTCFSCQRSASGAELFEFVPIAGA